MGVVISCVCSGENTKDQENKDCITIESKNIQKSKVLEEFIDIQNKRKLVILDVLFVENFFKNIKNFIIPSKFLIKTTEITNYYNNIFPCNFYFAKGTILLLLDFSSRINDNVSTCRSVYTILNKYNTLKSLDFKIEDLYLISSSCTKTIDLIEINIKANLKRNYELKGSILNINEFRCHKLIYKKIAREEVTFPYYFLIELKNFSKNTLEEILSFHSDKKLISLLFDYHDQNSDRSIILYILDVHYLIFSKKIGKRIDNEYLVEIIPISFSYLFLREFNKCLDNAANYKLCCLTVDSENILIVKKKIRYNE